MGTPLIDAAGDTAEVHGSLCFTRPTDVVDDHERRGLLRAGATMFDANGAEIFAAHDCVIRDCTQPGVAPFDLAGSGFDTIDLAPLSGLQATLERVRQASRIAPEDAAAIRQALIGQSFRLSDGRLLRLMFIAPEGLIIRKAGPNGLKTNPDEQVTETNGHEASQAVHSDQDVLGTPVRQLLRGFGPTLFRHEAPDSSNRFSPVFLINVWIPLQQVTRPLTLMDQRTIDRRHHQLRYALSTDNFLERDENTRVNDIWTFLHDDAQRWYFTSRMDARSAYVFNTLSTPHGAFILPGEAAAERRYLQLQAALAASRDTDATALLQCTTPLDDTLPPETTAPLREAIRTMDGLLSEAHAQTPNALAASDWSVRAGTAMDGLVRKSIELRAVAIVLPDIWPFNRSIPPSAKGG
jgi:hypothetical protein